MSVPVYDDLYNPLLDTLHQLGGSASVDEMEEKVAEILKLSDKEINEIHKGNKTKLRYQLEWSRNYLKRYGLLENSSRGVWSLNPKGQATKSVSKKLVNRKVWKLNHSKEDIAQAKNLGPAEQGTWRDKLLDTIKSLTPGEFERLCQRILREAGFTQVNITGKPGDRGIDGTGIVKIGGFLSFRIIFQCKRYKGSISSQQIREFKGTMNGRANRGLFLTTGIFTRDAKTEASRDGSDWIDLVDGDALVEKMKELGLGVTIKTEETVTIDKEWFKSF